MEVHKNKQSLLTDLKWVIVLFFSIEIGNIFMHFFEQTSMNVWIARGIGCTVCVLINCLIHKYVLKSI